MIIWETCPLALETAKVAFLKLKILAPAFRIH